METMRQGSPEENSKKNGVKESIAWIRNGFTQERSSDVEKDTKETRQLLCRGREISIHSPLTFLRTPMRRPSLFPLTRWRD